MVQEQKISTFLEFVRFIEKDCRTENILFRGQPHDAPLLPKIARINPKGDLIEVEQKMLSDLKRRSIPYLHQIYQNDWDWLALAQHHGMATRLLDWTKNPLAALWFTVPFPPERVRSVQSTGDRFGVIWVFAPSTQDIIAAETVASSRAQGPFEGERTKVFQPNCVTSRIVAQSGWFTVHKYLDNLHKFVPLESNRAHKESLTKVIVPFESFADFRYQLDRFGVNDASMFPDLDGVCRQVQWLHSFLEDEPPEGESKPLVSGRAEKRLKRRVVRPKRSE